jgi:hypothetical protein
VPAERSRLGLARALGLIRVHQQKSADTIVQVLISAAVNYAQNNPDRDDITAVIVKVETPA